MGFKEDLASDIFVFMDQHKELPNPKAALSDLIQRTHYRPNQPELFADMILQFFRQATVDDFLDPRNAPRLLPLVTVYGGPATEELVKTFWGSSMNTAGRYKWKNNHGPEGEIELKLYSNGTVILEFVSEQAP